MVSFRPATTPVIYAWIKAELKAVDLI